MTRRERSNMTETCSKTSSTSDMHTRRDAIALLPAAGLGTATLLGCRCFVGQAFAQAATPAASERPRAGDVFLSVNGSDAAAIEPKDIVPGAPIMAWPMDPVGRIVRNGSRLNKVLLLRL